MGRVFVIAVMVVAWAGSAAAQLGGPGWSAGLAVNTNVVGDVEQIATVDTFGVVQLVERKDQIVRPVLEGHVAFPVTPWVAVGPFLAAAPGEDIIDEIGFGGLAVLSRGEQTFSIGLGAWLNPNAQLLRDDFVVGQPSPAGATEVKYVTRGVWRLMLLFGLGL